MPLAEKDQASAAKAKRGRPPKDRPQPTREAAEGIRVSMVTINVPTKITINEKVYLGRVTVPEDVGAEIDSMVRKWQEHKRSLLEPGTPEKVHGGVDYQRFFETAISGAQYR